MPWKSNNEPIVISLGGSLVAPDGPDWQFVQKFVEIIKTARSQGKRFYIIVGGGSVARTYQQALSQLGSNNTDLDYIGIFATHLNAHFLSLAFGLDPKHKVVLKIDNLDADLDLQITGAGLEPGQSTDSVAIDTAIALGASRVFNLSNIKQIYDSDPKSNQDATPFKELNWDEYIKIIPEVWRPGLSTPFDPIASRKAQDNNIQVIITGADLDNFVAALNNQPYLGTIIS